MSSPSRRMQALIYDAPAPDASTTRVAELDVPAPEAGELTIRVTHAGVNFKDIMARRGDPGYVPAWPGWRWPASSTRSARAWRD